MKLCSECKYFNEMDSRCLRFPPQSVKYVLDSGWEQPRVRYADTCGEWSQKEYKEEV